MDGGGEDAGDRPNRIAEGEWAGWYSWSGHDPYESMVGPFYFGKIDGQPACGFRAERRHMNGGGFMNGGCIMSFADVALFQLSHKERQGAHGVTVTLNSEFLGSAYVGERMIATGETTKAGRSLVFVRGLITADDRPVLNFSGVIKKMRRTGDAG